MNLIAQLEQRVTGAKYYKLLLRDSLFGKITLCFSILTLILTFTWWCHDERTKFYQEMCSDGARTF